MIVVAFNVSQPRRSNWRPRNQLCVELSATNIQLKLHAIILIRHIFFLPHFIRFGWGLERTPVGTRKNCDFQRDSIGSTFAPHNDWGVNGINNCVIALSTPTHHAFHIHIDLTMRTSYSIFSWRKWTFIAQLPLFRNSLAKLKLRIWQHLNMTNKRYFPINKYFGIMNNYFFFLFFMWSIDNEKKKIISIKK